MLSEEKYSSASIIKKRCEEDSMMKTKNSKYLNIMLLPFSLMLALLCCLSGCAKTETSEVPVESASFSQKEDESSAPEEMPKEYESEQAEGYELSELDEQDIISMVIDELRIGNHSFEQEIAYRYYHDGKSRYELPDNYHNRCMARRCNWAFDSKGNGVFTVCEGAAAGSCYYL